MVGTPFKPGESGNPGGRPKENLEIKELARQHGPKMVEILVAIAANEGGPMPARVSAATALLDRGYGKPTQAVEHSGKDGDAIKHEHNIDAFIAEMAKLRKRREDTETTDTEET